MTNDKLERVARAIDEALPESDQFTLAPSQIRRAATAAIAACEAEAGELERVAYRAGMTSAAAMVRRFMGEQYGENSALMIDVDEGIQADKPTLAYVADALERRATAPEVQP